MAIDLVSTSGRQDEDAASLRTQPASVKGKPAPAARGTLTPADLTPAWRGQVQRTGL